MDRKSCDNLLNAIIDEKKDEDQKRRIKQQERLYSRIQMANRHNQKLQFAESLGVKMSMRGSPQNIAVVGDDSL